MTSPSTPPLSATHLEAPASHRRTKSLQSFLPYLSINRPRAMCSLDDMKATTPLLYLGDSDEPLKRCTKDPSVTELKDPASIKAPSEISCTRIFIYTSFVISAICVFLFLGHDYVRYVLLSLEQSSVCTSLLVFSLLFTAVSFPMTWGYILLNVAIGYLYGVVKGVPIVMTCAIFGVFTAHHVISRCFKDFVWKYLGNETMRSIVKVVESGSGMKVVALARLTPIPFGLQNALFAISNIPVHRYILASMLGMIPSQGLHVYIGSTLRSMEEVISANRSSSLAYGIFAAQFLIAIALLVFVLGKARLEFDRTLDEVKVVSDYQVTSSLSSSVPNSQSNKADNELTSDRLTLHRKPVLITAESKSN